MSVYKDMYREAVELTRRDLARQKMLLPPETIAELCSTYCRQPRRVAELFGSKPLIAGIQKTFPESGVTAADFKPLEQSQTFESAGAGAVAVVTEPHFFEGAPKYLTGVTHLVKVPVIRWDFIIEEYQLAQSKLWGADAVRLIVELLDQSALALLCAKAAELDLEIIAEVVSSADVERLSSIKNIAAICVNAPDLEEKALQDLLAQAQNHSPALLNIDNISIEKAAKLAADGWIYFRAAIDSAEPGKRIQELAKQLQNADC